MHEDADYDDEESVRHEKLEIGFRYPEPVYHGGRYHDAYRCSDESNDVTQHEISERRTRHEIREEESGLEEPSAF